ncbi:hypothetical protein [Microcoleus vaginatus]
MDNSRILVSLARRICIRAIALLATAITNMTFMNLINELYELT